jgi:hypothetical protein
MKYLDNYSYGEAQSGPIPKLYYYYIVFFYDYFHGQMDGENPPNDLSARDNL